MDGWILSQEELGGVRTPPCGSGPLGQTCSPSRPVTLEKRGQATPVSALGPPDSKAKGTAAAPSFLHRKAGVGTHVPAQHPTCAGAEQGAALRDLPSLVLVVTPVAPQQTLSLGRCQWDLEAGGEVAGS